MKKFRINVFDIVMVLACIVLVYGAYLFAAPQQAIAETGTRIRFTLEFPDRPAGFYQSIEPGIIVHESIRGQVIGTVVEAYGRPSQRDVPDEANNIIRRASVEGREFTYVVVEAWADVTEMETLVNQFRIAVNRPVYIRSRDFAGSGIISGMEFLD